jgi:hypothetical protein
MKQTDWYGDSIRKVKLGIGWVTDSLSNKLVTLQWSKLENLAYTTWLLCVLQNSL